MRTREIRREGEKSAPTELGSEEMITNAKKRAQSRLRESRLIRCDASANASGNGYFCFFAPCLSKGPTLCPLLFFFYFEVGQLLRRA